MNITKMDDVTKAMLFMFLGLVICILVLGFHKSPQASTELARKRASATRTPSQKVSSETYPSDRSDYN